MKEIRNAVIAAFRAESTPKTLAELSTATGFPEAVLTEPVNIMVLDKTLTRSSVPRGPRATYTLT